MVAIQSNMLTSVIRYIGIGYVIVQATTDDTAVYRAIPVYRVSLYVPLVLCRKAMAVERESLFRIVRVGDGERMALFLILTSKRSPSAGPLFTNCSYNPVRRILDRIASSYLHLRANARKFCMRRGHTINVILFNTVIHNACSVSKSIDYVHRQYCAMCIGLKC